MQNFIKTLGSAFQTWTKKEIKNSTADWNQNDSDANNYIKNRPFYEEEGLIHIIDSKYLPDKLTNTLTLASKQSVLSSDYTLQNNMICVNNKIIVLPRPYGEGAAKAAYSEDGIHWLETDLPVQQQWNKPIYLNGKFIAFPNNGFESDKAAYSLDGITWVETALPTNQRWQLVEAENKVIAFPHTSCWVSNIAAYTEDGISWIKVQLPLDQYWQKPVYANGKFVALPYKTSYVGAYSEDGITWTRITLPTYYNTWSPPSYVGNKFFATTCSTTTQNRIAYSEDGINWNLASKLSASTWREPIYANGKFVTNVSTNAHNNKVAYSDDGINWIENTLPTSATWQGIQEIGGKLFLKSNSGNILLYSEDGVTWYQNTQELLSNQRVSQISYINNKFLLITYSGTIAYSEDGITWSLANYSFDASNAYFIHYINNKFFLNFTISCSNIAYSEDGVNWKLVELPSTSTWGAPIYATDKFITSSNDNPSVIAYSEDGIIWKDTYNYIEQNNEDITNDVKEVLNIDKLVSDSIEVSTDEEIIEMLMQEDMFPIVTDSDGSILADENENILLW